MKRINKDHRIKLYKIIEIILIMMWLVAMKDSDAYFIPYLIVGVSGILCCYNRKLFGFKKLNPITIIFTLLFTFFTTIANYNLFSLSFSWSNLLQIILQIISIVIGGFISFYNVLIYTPELLKKVKTPKTQSAQQKFKPSTVFLISFGIISIVYFLVLFLCKYPGNLSFDSIYQIEQGITGDYTNRHPFLSTIFLTLFFNLGQGVFQNSNAGVATFLVAQIIIMAAIFAFSIMTIYQSKCSKKTCIILLLIYILTPYHIMYSLSVWKDVLFSSFILLFLISQYRIFYNIGTRWLNYLILSFSSILFCLFRGNGIYLIISAILFFIIIFRKQIIQKKSLILNFGILFLTAISYFIFNSVIISTFNVTKTEKMESLSIPAQQIARTIKDSNDLSESQIDLLKNVADLNSISEDYIPWLSDPIKEQVWHSDGGESYLLEHKSDFIKLYLELGATHPIQYLQAWTDQTKGFFNSGYHYWVINDEIISNNLNIQRINNQSVPNKLFDAYLGIFENNSFFRIVYCIGFYVWIAIWLLYCAIISKRKNESFLILIPLSLIATLLIATPVFSEFRYAYPLFCSLPFLLIITLKQISLLSKNEKNIVKRKNGL